MPDHYFAPRIEFAPKGDPRWIAEAIAEWENGGDASGPRVLGTNGRALPDFPALEPGLVEHRWGSFAGGAECQYRLRLEVTGARRRVRIGLLFAGPDLPGPETRGGGELVQRLVGNWKHRPEAATFPTRLREVTEPAGLRELFEQLVDPRRRAPLVLVTRRSRSEELVADPARLHDYLVGMAEVWSVPETSLTFGLGQEFASRGFDPRWNCYDGGVRLYLPGLDPQQDLLGRHPLVLATRLLSHEDPTAAAAAWALGAVTRVLGVDEWRAQWREGIAGRRPISEGGAKLAELDGLRQLQSVLAEPDVEIDARPLDEAIEEAPEDERPTASHVTVVGVELPATLDEARVPDEATGPSVRAESPIARAETSSADRANVEDVVIPIEAPVHPDLEPTPEARPRAAKPQPRPSRIQRGLASLRDAFDAFADLEGLLEELEDELEALRVERDALALERDELSQDLQDLEQERVGRELRLPSTIDDVLALFDEIGGDAFRVTSYARRKANGSKYADLRLLGHVLAVLLAVGPDFGHVQSALRTSVGRRARARPKESRQTLAKFGQHRTFVLDDGSVAEVEQHVTLGHGTRNLNETLQLYWRRAPDGATEIVYVGEHLPTVSENT